MPWPAVPLFELLLLEFPPLADAAAAALTEAGAVEAGVDLAAAAGVAFTEIVAPGVETDILADRPGVTSTLSEPPGDDTPTVPSETLTLAVEFETETEKVVPLTPATRYGVWTSKRRPGRRSTSNVALPAR